MRKSNEAMAQSEPHQINMAISAEKNLTGSDLGLVREAITARQDSYSPYSGFKVGAALLTKDGKVYRGCNIENAAYTPTNCAERTAFFKAVSEGEREFVAIAVAGWADSGSGGMAYPCGVCRQVMMEFCDPKSFRILIASGADHFLGYTGYTLKELLPFGFGPSDLNPLSQ